MAKIQNLDKVMAVLKGKAEDGKDASVTVGYTQSYAIYVHENLEANHPVGQAKFLEYPARDFASVISGIIQKAYKNGLSMVDSLMLGGMRLQRESQKLCPVDTGALRASAFTRIDK